MYVPLKQQIPIFTCSTIFPESIPTTPIQQPTHQPTHKISGADLASYQFPVDDEEEEEEGGDTSDGPVAQHTPSLNKQPPASALKKSPSDGGVSSTYDVCELKYLLQYRLYDCQQVLQILVPEVEGLQV